MELRAKVEPSSGKHSAYTHFPKDPKLRYLLGGKQRGLLAEDELVQSCPVRKMLVTRKQQITKFSLKKVHRVTIIDMPWWYKIWQRSDYNPTYVKQK